MRSAQLVNQKQFYMSISRAQQEARIYTDDAQVLRRTVGRDQGKEVALEVVQTRLTQQLPAFSANNARLHVDEKGLQTRAGARAPGGAKGQTGY
jgi:hypothetical protein